MMKRVCRLFVVLLSLCFVGIALAQERCQPEGQTLQLAGIGTASFAELQFSSSEGKAVLFGGVCVVSDAKQSGQPQWTLQTERLEVSQIDTSPTVVANEVELSFGGWMIQAASLRVDAGVMVLENLRFTQGEVSGRAVRGRYDLTTGRVSVSEVEAINRRYRVSGAHAVLLEQALIFEDALATTCLCSGDALYVITTPQMTFDLLQESIVIRNGVLEIGTIDIELAEELELSEKSFAELEPPLEVSYLEGAGTTIQLVHLPLAEDVFLTTGLTGLDPSHAFAGVLLFEVETEGVAALVGRAPQGVQLDVTLTEPLNPWLELILATRNRHWPEQDFLHDASLSLAAQTSWRDPGKRHRLSFGAQATTAISHQIILEQAVTSTRLALQGHARYTHADTGWGRVSLASVVNLSYYPAYERAQYGLRLTPGWSLQRSWQTASLSASLRYDLRLTNSASPFSEALDRLEPLSLLSGQLEFSSALAAEVSLNTQAVLEYNFLADPRQNESGFQRTYFSAALAIPTGELMLRPQAALELASLLSGVDDEYADAYAEAGLTLEAPAFTVGSTLRYDLFPGQEGLSRLELSGSLPIVMDAVVLEPYLALDFVDVLRGSGAVDIVGHGLDLTWNSCCGTLLAGYRLYRGDFQVSLSARLVD